MPSGFFVTGTDTEVGKTTIAAGLLRCARQVGLSTAAVKPLASGCESTLAGLRNSDALALQAECSLVLNYAQVNPFAFAPPIAPHLAASQAGVVLDIESLVTPVRHVLSMAADITVVEGAGGWRVPLSGKASLSDVAIALGLPVILVVGVRLGCINHALLSAQAILADGLPLAGWVANVVDRQTACIDEVLSTLEGRLPVPCLGRVPWLDAATPAAVAGYIRFEALQLNGTAEE